MFRTISFDDRNQIDLEEMDLFIAFLENSFPLVHKELKRTRINSYSLLFEWQGKDSSLLPALLMAHMDVVPLGDLDVWSYPAFDGRITEGYIWGRGAIDDKNNVLAILETAEVFLSRGFQPERNLIFAFGHDEEISGTSGAAFIAEHLKSRGIKAEFVLDEGFAVIDGIMPGITGPVALVGTEEKGAFNMRMDLRVIGGHASMPPPSTAIGRIARAIKAVEDNPMQARITGAVKDMFDTLAPEMSLPFRVVMSNRWLFEKILLWVLTRQPTTAATVRTTRAATIINAGTKSNVLPSTINATWNVRVAPHDSVDSVIENFKYHFNDPEIQVTVLDPLQPSPYTPMSSLGYKTVERAIRTVWPTVPVAPGLTVGNTDTRHFWDISDCILRFSPIYLHKDDVKRMHGIDERIGVDVYRNNIDFYYHLMKNL